MRPSQKRLIVEAGIAIGVLAILLYLMLPRFLSVQRYGPIDVLKCQTVDRTWTWNNDILTQSSTMEQTLLVFTPEIKNGVLSCKALVYEGQEGVQLVFGYQNRSEFCIWNLGSYGNTSTRLEYWFPQGSLNQFQGRNVMTSVSSKGGFYTEWVPTQPYHFTYNKWHDIRLVLNSNALTVEGFVDDQSIIRYNLPAPVSGKMGLCTWWTKAQFKDIQITPIE